METQQTESTFSIDSDKIRLWYPPIKTISDLEEIFMQNGKHNLAREILLSDSLEQFKDTVLARNLIDCLAAQDENDKLQDELEDLQMEMDVKQQKFSSHSGTKDKLQATVKQLRSDAAAHVQELKALKGELPMGNMTTDRMLLIAVVSMYVLYTTYGWITG